MILRQLFERIRLLHNQAKDSDVVETGAIHLVGGLLQFHFLGRSPLLLLWEVWRILLFVRLDIFSLGFLEPLISFLLLRLKPEEFHLFPVLITQLRTDAGPPTHDRLASHALLVTDASLLTAHHRFAAHTALCAELNAHAFSGGATASLAMGRVIQLQFRRRRKL